MSPALPNVFIHSKETTKKCKGAEVLMKHVVGEINIATASVDTKDPAQVKL